jgi:hypothetical protein
MIITPLFSLRFYFHSRQEAEKGFEEGNKFVEKALLYLNFISAEMTLPFVFF